MDTQMVSFRTAADWEEWLQANHSTRRELWLRIFKKSSGKETVTYAEALDVALCYGWIDGLKKSYDAESWIQRFCPRRPKSLWSKLNTQHVARLRKAGRMKPPGLAAVEAAKQDGRWKAAYDSPGKAVIPEDFLKRLTQNRKAEAFYRTLSRGRLYSIAWRLQTATKPETRERRMKAILEMLASGKAFHGSSSPN
jgi:uncharacterized protein YdeI (YjbR/CyaY-like superfamily)